VSSGPTVSSTWDDPPGSPAAIGYAVIVSDDLVSHHAHGSGGMNCADARTSLHMFGLAGLRACDARQHGPPVRCTRMGDRFTFLPRGDHGRARGGAEPARLQGDRVTPRGAVGSWR
jgi:hypothetical protein